MILKRDMTAAESNYLQCAVMIIVAGVLIVVVSDWDAFGWGSALMGVAFFIGFLYLKKKEDKAAIDNATRTVRKDQPRDSFKVRYTTRKERKARKQEAEEKGRKNFPANKSTDVKKKQEDKAKGSSRSQNEAKPEPKKPEEQK